MTRNKWWLCAGIVVGVVCINFIAISLQNATQVAVAAMEKSREQVGQALQQNGEMTVLQTKEQDGYLFLLCSYQKEDGTEGLSVGMFKKSYLYPGLRQESILYTDEAYGTMVEGYNKLKSDRTGYRILIFAHNGDEKPLRLSSDVTGSVEGAVPKEILLQPGEQYLEAFVSKEQLSLITLQEVE